MSNSQRPRRPITGNNNGDVGTLTHILIGAHVQFADTPHVHGDLLDRVFAVANALIDANPNATRVLAAEAAGHAYTYLTDCVPAAPWTLLAVEFDTGDGPVDLAWVNMNNGQVMYDEIKTSRVTRARVIPPAWVTQARRYAIAGTDAYGSSFVGTRLIPLMATHESRLVAATGPAATICPTPTHPLQVAAPPTVPVTSQMTRREAQAYARATNRNDARGRTPTAGGTEARP